MADKGSIIYMNTTPMSGALKLRSNGARKDLMFVVTYMKDDGSWGAFFFVYDVLTGNIEKYDKDSLAVC